MMAFWYNSFVAKPIESGGNKVLENNREIKCKKDGIYTESVKHRFSRIKQYMLIRESSSSH